jgi:hypothetical protein
MDWRIPDFSESPPQSRVNLEKEIISLLAGAVAEEVLLRMPCESELGRRDCELVDAILQHCPGTSEQRSLYHRLLCLEAKNLVETHRIQIFGIAMALSVTDTLTTKDFLRLSGPYFWHMARSGVAMIEDSQFLQ